MEQHNTLHYDKTSKEGFKYGSIQVTTEQDQSYVLGLFDMDGGAEQDQSYVLRLFDMDGGAAITHRIMMRRAKKTSNTGLSR